MKIEVVIDWCWLMLIDVDWCWLMLIYVDLLIDAVWLYMIYMYIYMITTNSPPINHIEYKQHVPHPKHPLLGACQVSGKKKAADFFRNSLGIGCSSHVVVLVMLVHWLCYSYVIAMSYLCCRNVILLQKAWCSLSESFFGSPGPQVGDNRTTDAGLQPDGWWFNNATLQKSMAW